MSQSVISNLHWKDNITKIPGVGPKKAQLLEGLGISTIEDFLLHYPRDYEDRRFLTPVCDMKDGEKLLVRARVRNIRKNGFGRNVNISLTCEDATGSFEALFFHAAFLLKSVFQGAEYDFYGTVSMKDGRRRMIHPEFSKPDDDNRGILPIYPLTSGITNNELRKWHRKLKDAGFTCEDYLDDRIKARNNLCDLDYAVRNIHFPEDGQKVKEAKYRLIFDEFLIMQLGILAMKSSYSHVKGIMFSQAADEGEYIDQMPYPLTGAQQRAVRDIMADMESDQVMNRLLQGDVGSGKTAVAEIALFKAVKSGYQGVLMAPTEILAYQHFEGLKKSFDAFGIHTVFLGGRMKAQERRDVLEAIEDGRADIIIGTHAIIQSSVAFHNLGLVITDEQHRFGVNQRALLSSKGEHPDRLLMTATPIPRTLAVVLYGELDVSIIDKLPAGRKPVRTKALTARQRNKAYQLMEEEVRAGKQGYIVTPLITENEELSIRSVEETYAEAIDRFPDFKVAMLHGAMKSSEKDEIMEQFARNEIQILVATVVIEVGINVPNATVMIIENAERFGLAQLHQLRGRVGRGKHQSSCLLITDGKSEIAVKRAEIMESSNDGFYIAEEDLKLRGPGEIFGTRQHGLPDLRLADMVKHGKVLARAAAEAKKIMLVEESFYEPENQMLQEKVKKLFGDEITLNI